MADDVYDRKERPTYYTPEIVAAARENVQTYDWAADRAEAAVERADAFLDRRGGVEGIWAHVTGQEIPRSAGISRAGSPITGEELITDYGKREWVGDSEIGPSPDKYDVVDGTPDPWTLVDPSSGYVFPTNDFAAYRESGRDDRGFFDPDRADDSLLVNERYPDKPDDWGVDDGYGWTDADGNTFTFVAFYNHFHVWYAVRNMARVFRDAFLMTGDPTYSRAGTVLLDRIADTYPELDIGAWGPDAPFGNSHGGTGQGKAVGSIWETRMAIAYASCYDAVFAGQAGDAEIVTTLDTLGEPYDLGEKSTIGDIRGNIEEGIIRDILPSVQEAKIRGNFGYHQSALAWAAVVADDPGGYTDETIDFLFRPGGKVSTDDGSPWGRHEVTGGEVLNHIVDEFDRDGFHYESPNYNQRKPERLAEIADILADYEAYEGPDLVTHARVEKMQPALIHLIMCNRYYPHIGDSDGTGDPHVLLPESMEQAFRWYDDPLFIQALAARATARGEDATGADLVEPEVFDPDPDAFTDRVTAILESDGPLDLPSENFAGYGFAALRDGEIDQSDPAAETRREAWVHYGRHMSSHNHADILNLGLFAAGLNLLPDLGYPENTGSWPKRRNWTENTTSHNTVTVNRRMQENQWVADPNYFGATDRVQLVDVSAPAVYPQTDTYRRATVMCHVDAERSYLVDVFRVAGGEDHLFSFHAAEGEASTEGLDLVEQDDGTYAGPDVPVPEHGEDSAYNEAGEQTAHRGPVNDGWNYLSNVARDDDPPERFAVEWDVEDTWDVRDDDADEVAVRLTMFGDVDDVALADGPPPDKPGNPDSLRYALARRSGDELETTFTSIVEAFEGDGPVVDAAPVRVTEPNGTPVSPQTARAVRVKLETGRVDYIASATETDESFVVDDSFRFRGGIAVYAEDDGAPEYAYVHAGDELGSVQGDAIEPLIDEPPGELTGEVTAFTRELTTDNYIEVELADLPAVSLAELTGRWIYVDTDGDPNGAYRIEGIDEQDGTTVRLDVGDVSTVEEFVDPGDPDAGYEYVIATGDAARIPLTAEWTG